VINRFYTKGFTLIELLVVIAIIGILASVVLASLGASRDKSRDAAIKESLTSLRSQIELYYATYRYYAAAGYGGNGDCEDMYGTTIANSVLNDSKVKEIITYAMSQSGVNPTNDVDDATNGYDGASFCSVRLNPDGWAVAVRLASDPNLAFCVDHTGNATVYTGVSANLGAAITNGTSMCN